MRKGVRGVVREFQGNWTQDEVSRFIDENNRYELPLWSPTTNETLYRKNVSILVLNKNYGRQVQELTQFLESYASQRAPWREYFNLALINETPEFVQ